MHTSQIETGETSTRFPLIWRAVCADGCGHGKWRTAESTAKADARQHARDTTEAETYRSSGGVDL